MEPNPLGRGASSTRLVRLDGLRVFGKIGFWGNVEPSPLIPLPGGGEGVSGSIHLPGGFAALHPGLQIGHPYGVQ